MLWEYFQLGLDGWRTKQYCMCMVGEGFPIGALYAVSTWLPSHVSINDLGENFYKNQYM